METVEVVESLDVSILIFVKLQLSPVSFTMVSLTKNPIRYTYNFFAVEKML